MPRFLFRIYWSSFFGKNIHGGAVSGGTFCLGEKFLLKILMDEGKVEWQFSTT
jgi:hypothetical protein